LEHPTRTSSLGGNKAGRTARMAESPTGLSPKVDRRTAVSAEREVNGDSPSPCCCSISECCYIQ
jgi:hypothetical protein